MLLHCYFEKILHENWDEKLSAIVNISNSIPILFHSISCSHLYHPIINKKITFFITQKLLFEIPQLDMFTCKYDPDYRNN